MANKHTLRIPPRFWEDHMERECEAAESEVKRGSQIEVTLSDAALSDLRSDVSYYASFIGSGEDFVKDSHGRSICRSARRTLEIIKAYDAARAARATA